MSNSSFGSLQQERTQISKPPRALIHKQILDIADSQPTASVEELAAEVSGATTNLVERVLEEYGDPADDDPVPDPAEDDGDGQADPVTEPVTAAMTEHDTPQEQEQESELVQLTEKQRETLQAIAEQPDATQQQLAEQFDVSRATINKRVNSIDGFEWADRQAFITTMVDDGETTPESGPPSRDAPELADRIDTLAEQVTELEHQVAERPDSPERAFTDPDLVHKVVHACMNSDQITEDEELRILDALLTTQDRGD